MKRSSLIITALALSLSGCMVGPNYRRPQVATPDKFRGAPVENPSESASTPQSIAEIKWFDLFQDDTLKQLVSRALGKNFDLRIAAERVLEARAQYGIARANLFPTVDGQAQFTANRSSSIGSFPFIRAGTDLSASYTQATANLNWELDLWGRLRRLNQAARAQYLASEEARNGVIISLVGDVTNTYFAMREQDLELEISRQTGAIATDNLRLINLRHDRGVANALEVHQAEQFLYTATGQVAAAERQIGQSENALSLLLGNAPGDIPRGKSLDKISAPPELPPGLPSSLLERRPDIRQAEESLIAANAQIGAARALLVPQVSLTGLFGGQSRALSELFTGPARLSTLGPSVTIPIFRAGLRSGIQLTEAQQREALAAYEKSIYGALREVSDALVVHDRTQEQRIEEEKLVATLTESVRLSTLRYQGGLDSYLQVLDAERNLFGGQLTLAQLRLQELQSVVQLYRVLGGGWQ
jgi:NodT family efflux transporter outer membrane factor (OMF) lipoprotein